MPESRNHTANLSVSALMYGNAQFRIAAIGFTEQFDSCGRGQAIIQHYPGSKRMNFIIRKSSRAQNLIGFT